MRYKLKETLEHVYFLAKHIPRDRPDMLITILLLELGIPTHYDGFDYLMKAIPTFSADPSQMITKGLYPTISQMYEKRVSISQIERSIRGSVQYAWDRRNEEVWLRYFPPNENGELIKPSNAEFVSRLGYVVDLWQSISLEAAE